MTEWIAETGWGAAIVGTIIVILIYMTAWMIVRKL